MAIFRFDNYMEQWAQMYKPISHDPRRGSKEKGFVRMDSIMRPEEVISKYPNLRSPFIGVITQNDMNPGGHSGQNDVFTYRLYVFVKQVNGGIDEIAAADAKADAVDIALDILAWLEGDKENHKELLALDLDGASVFNIPQKIQSWWAAEIVIDNPRKRCRKVDKSKYIDNNP